MLVFRWILQGLLIIHCDKANWRLISIIMVVKALVHLVLLAAGLVSWTNYLVREKLFYGYGVLVR